MPAALLRDKREKRQRGDTFNAAFLRAEKEKKS
jgi:hypothetical protein